MEETKLTARDILVAIGALNSESQHINEALKQLELVKSQGPVDVGAQATAMAIADIVESREKTLRQTLSLYEKMYDDLQKSSAE